MKPLISIILVNYNGLKFLPELFSCIKKQTYPNIELIFVDNGSKDDSIQFVQTAFPTAIIIGNKKNLGFAAANNIGYKQANGTYVLLLNCDTTFNANLIDELYSSLSSLNADAVSPKILFEQDFIPIKFYGRFPQEENAGHYISEQVKIEGAGVSNLLFSSTSTQWLNGKLYIRIENDLTVFVPIQVSKKYQATKITLSLKNENFDDIEINTNIGNAKVHKGSRNIEFKLSENEIEKHKVKLINSTGLLIDENSGRSRDLQFGKINEHQNNIKKVKGLTACCVLVKKEIIEKAGLFDATFFAYYEDVDFFLRLQSLGFSKFFCCCHIEILHKVSSSFSKFKKEKTYLIERNRLRCLKKNGSMLNYTKEAFVFGLYTIMMKLGYNRHYAVNRAIIHKQVILDNLFNKEISDINSIFNK